MTETKQTDYKPVPVKIAREIAEEYDKAIVIINTWDTKHGLLHTTTYGASEVQKHQAAKGGDIAAKALGADMPRSNFYEDFRKNGGRVYTQQDLDQAKREVAKECIGLSEMTDEQMAYLEEKYGFSLSEPVLPKYEG